MVLALETNLPQRYKADGSACREGFTIWPAHAVKS